jgi:NADH-quinone oxidoreductase subunit L
MEMRRLFEGEVVRLILLSSVIVFAGLGLGWWFYGRQPVPSADSIDPLERIRPDIYTLLKRKYFVDEIYEWSVVQFNSWFARACNWLDTWIWNGAVQLVSYAIIGLSWVNRVFDEKVVNLGFDEGCHRLSQGGGLLSRLQDGRVQNYLRVIGVALTALLLFLIWGCRAS